MRSIAGQGKDNSVRLYSSLPSQDPTKLSLWLLSCFFILDQLTNLNCTEAESRKLIHPKILSGMRSTCKLILQYFSTCRVVDCTMLLSCKQDSDKMWLNENLLEELCYTIPDIQTLYIAPNNQQQQSPSHIHSQPLANTQLTDNTILTTNTEQQPSRSNRTHSF